MTQGVSANDDAGAPVANVVHVWIAQTGAPELRDAFDLLDDGERRRYEAQKNVPHRRDYAAAHALKRMALAWCLPGGDPSALKFGRLSSGKPYLLDAPLHFNLSHSRGFVAVAVSPDNDVGMDIEVHGCETSARIIAERTMTAPERAAIAAASNPLQSFYERWTIKEALVKGTGRGLATEFRSLCTECDLTRVCSGRGQIGAFDVFWRSEPTYSYAASCLGAGARFVEHTLSGDDALCADVDGRRARKRGN